MFWESVGPVLLVLLLLLVILPLVVTGFLKGFFAWLFYGGD